MMFLFLKIFIFTTPKQENYNFIIATYTWQFLALYALIETMFYLL